MGDDFYASIAASKRRRRGFNRITPDATQGEERPMHPSRKTAARLLLLLTLLLLVVAPVVAQQTVSTPSPTTIVSEFRESAETFGSAVVILFVLLVAVAAGVLLGIKYIMLPLITSNTTQNQVIVADRLQITNALLDASRSQAAAALVNERMLATMNNIETHEQAQTARAAVASNINTHTDSALKPLSEKLDGITLALQQLLEVLSRKAVTQETIDASIKPLIEQVNQMVRDIHALQHPPVLPLAPVDGAKLPTTTEQEPLP